MSWTWPEGKTFGELSAADKRIAAQRAGAQLERELIAMAPAIERVMALAELGPCHICGGEADGACAICDRPVCDDDARHQDHDRFCRSCAPHPGSA
jgi:hypothetical protein